MLIPGATPLNRQQLAWNELTSHLEHWYASPDIEGLKIALCSLATHYYTSEKALWLLAIGESGSGKTEILIRSFEKFPKARLIGSVTPKCFLSAYKNGKNDTKDHSILNCPGGENQIWLAQDFTDFAAMRLDDRALVAATLRKIHDGSLSDATGVSGFKDWKGKVTLFAVATPGFEKHWSALKDLGERFMTLRWREGNRAVAMGKARTQAGKEQQIHDNTQNLMLQILDGRANCAEMPSDESMHRRDKIAELICQLRRHVERETYGRREVTEVSNAEFPSRVSFALSQIIRTHMDLFHRDRPGPDEFTLAERLAIDTIPVAFRKILECVPPGENIPFAALARRVKLPDATLRRRLEDLMLFDIIEPYSQIKWESKMATLTPAFTELLCDSGIRFHNRGALVEMPRLVKRLGHKASFLVEKDD